MTTRILLIFTRSPLHVGAGASVGAVDQPVIRERHTGFPVIPGSSLKGALRDQLQLAEQDTDSLFGTMQRSGNLGFGEAKLVAFPVRSAKGAFALAVSPLSLQRLNRDAGWTLPVPELAPGMNCLAGAAVTYEEQKAIVLEEYRFAKQGPFPADWEDKLGSLLGDAVLAGAKGRFVLLNDEDLSHFAVNACPVNQHVRIDEKTGTADEGGLFNTQTVPSETLFYAPLTVLRQEAQENAAFEVLKQEMLIQLGGDATTGLGFCAAKLI